MRLDLNWWPRSLRLRHLGASVLLAVGLVVGTLLAVGLSTGALAAGATYTGNCPDFTTFKANVEAVAGGESATFTFDTTYGCVYPASAASTISIQAGATVTIDGNSKLKIEGGTADAPGDYDLFTVADGADFTLDGATLQYGERGIAANFNGEAAKVTVKNSTIEESADDGINSSLGDVTVEQSTVTQNGGTGVYAGWGNITITNSTITNNGDAGVVTDYEDAYTSDIGSINVTGSTIANNDEEGVYTYYGDITITSSSLDSNGGDGIIVYEAGSVTAKQSTLRNNGADGIETSAHGDYQSVVTIEDCTITGNTRYGIHNHADDQNGSISVTNSVVSDNGKGDPDNHIDSGITAESGDITVASSIVNGNGDNGVHTYEGDIVVTNSTISGNGVVDSNNTESVVTYAGAFADEGDITVTNSTISKNLAYGVNAADGGATVVLSTIRGNGVGETAKYGVNASGAINLTGTILADNAAANCGAAATDHGSNLSTDASCSFSNSQNDVASADLSLQPLADNGGPSVGAPGAQQVLQTIALGPGSIAIDRVPADVCVDLAYPDSSKIDTDERGITRPTGPSCDSGAYEAPAIKLSHDSGDPNSNGWYKSDVTVTVDYSGLVTGETLNCSDVSDLSVTAQTFDASGELSHQFSDGSNSIDCGITLSSENLGFSYTGPKLPLSLQIDSVAPNITITTPADGHTYTLNQQVQADYRCTDTDGSGIVTCVGTKANTALIDTGTFGEHSFTVNASDLAGNTASKTVDYTVGYEIAHLSGFTNSVRRGYYAVIRIAPEDAQGHDYARRGLTVTSVDLVGPDGQTIPFAHQFQFGRFSGQPGYQLSINTRNLTPGTWTLQVKIGTGAGAQTSSVTFTVV